jgi:chromosome transmission fidelity protein 18
MHLLCRVEKKPELTYSTREMLDNRYRLEANLGLTHKFAEGLSPKYRGSRASDAIVKEMVPYALWMLSAGDGSSALSRLASSVEILKQRELESFVKHSETLRTLGLTYVASSHDEHLRIDDGDIHMVLDPPIHRLVHYQYLNRAPESGRKPIPSPVSFFGLIPALCRRSCNLLTLVSFSDERIACTPRRAARNPRLAFGHPNEQREAIW